MVRWYFIFKLSLLAIACVTAVLLTLLTYLFISDEIVHSLKEAFFKRDAKASHYTLRINKQLLKDQNTTEEEEEADTEAVITAQVNNKN